MNIAVTYTKKPTQNSLSCFCHFEVWLRTCYYTYTVWQGMNHY